MTRKDELQKKNNHHVVLVKDIDQRVVNEGDLREFFTLIHGWRLVNLEWVQDEIVDNENDDKLANVEPSSLCHAFVLFLKEETKQLALNLPPSDCLLSNGQVIKIEPVEEIELFLRNVPQSEHQRESLETSILSISSNHDVFRNVVDIQVRLKKNYGFVNFRSVPLSPQTINGEHVDNLIYDCACCVFDLLGEFRFGNNHSAMEYSWSIFSPNEENTISQQYLTNTLFVKFFNHGTAGEMDNNNTKYNWFEMTEMDIRRELCAIFGAYGFVNQCDVPIHKKFYHHHQSIMATNNNNEQTKGYAFVHFSMGKECARAYNDHERLCLEYEFAKITLSNNDHNKNHDHSSFPGARFNKRRIFSSPYPRERYDERGGGKRYNEQETRRCNDRMNDEVNRRQNYYPFGDYNNTMDNNGDYFGKEPYTKNYMVGDNYATNSAAHDYTFLLDQLCRSQVQNFI